MKRRILNINLQDRITNTEIRKRTKVEDVIELGRTNWENDKQQMNAEDNRMETMGKQRRNEMVG